MFIERVWRSLKYEEVYLHAYSDLAEARRGIGEYFRFYNDERPHQALGWQTPTAFYELMAPNKASPNSDGSRPKTKDEARLNTQRSSSDIMSLDMAMA